MICGDAARVLVEPDEATNRTAKSIVECVARVRTQLGVGLLEAVYKSALAYELRKRGHHVIREHRVQVFYDGQPLEGSYKVDLLVDGMVVEAKACEDLHPSAFAQTLTYLRFTDTRVGLLVNFHAVPLKNGIHRLIRRE